MKEMDRKKINNEIQKIKNKMNKRISWIWLDILKCKINYHASIEDYIFFEMYRLNKYERQTVVTRGINNEYILKYNDPKYAHIFQNKVEFYKTFSKYINHDWIEVKGKKNFATFCDNHSVIIAKKGQSNEIQNMERINVSEHKLKDLYEELIENKQTLVEEVFAQNEELKAFNNQEINIIEVITLLGNTVAAYLNMNSWIAPIDIETGSIKRPAIDKNENVYEEDPITKKKIIGFEIPSWDEIKCKCEEAALEVPQVGYVSWSISVGNNEIYFINGNDYPTHDLYKMPYKSNNIGLLPDYRSTEERIYEE